MEEEDLNAFAVSLKEKLAGCYHNVHSMQSQVTQNRFDLVVNFPRFRKHLDEEWSAIVATGSAAEIVARCIDMTPSDVSFTDISAFVAAFRSFADDVESNVSVFRVTINPLHKTPEFVTPIAANIKTALTNRINAILATVI